MRADFDWVFFDCFNTLIDDFDDSGDESGLGSLPDLAVQLGVFATRNDFHVAYRAARNSESATGREVTFDRRLALTLAQSPSPPPAARQTALVAAWLEQWDQAYRRLIRPTPGVQDMLTHWSQTKRLGVVSNFFLPGYPERYLRGFGLAHHFQFILDSAAFGYRKPHRALFDRALQLADLPGTQAHRVLMIGDRLDLDIIPARLYGMKVLHFNRQHTRPNTAASPAGIPCIYDLADFR